MYDLQQPKIVDELYEKLRFGKHLETYIARHGFMRTGHLMNLVACFHVHGSDIPDELGNCTIQEIEFAKEAVNIFSLDEAKLLRDYYYRAAESGS